MSDDSDRAVSAEEYVTKRELVAAIHGIEQVIYASIHMTVMSGKTAPANLTVLIEKFRKEVDYLRTFTATLKGD